jgi:hypothetical protein
MTNEPVATSPQMAQIITQLGVRHAAVWACAGAYLSLARADRSDRWVIAALSGHRISVTHCWVEADECLSPDLEMVFARQGTGWEPLELLHTDTVWQTYTHAARGCGFAIYDDQGDVLFAHFTEYWACQLIQQGWVDHSYVVEEGRRGRQTESQVSRQMRLVGCQSSHPGACYGEVWPCAGCGKTVCFAEGSDHHPELCDVCWGKHYAAQKEEGDVPC